MIRVDVATEMAWLQDRGVINCDGGVSTYEGFEAAAWILKPLWTHPLLGTALAPPPRRDAPRQPGISLLDGIDLSDEGLYGFRRMRSAPRPPWSRISWQSLFDELGLPFNLYDAVSPVGKVGAPEDNVPHLPLEYGMGEPGASSLFSILERHTDGGREALVDCYRCTLHGLGFRTGSTTEPPDQMHQLTLGEVRSNVAAHDLDEVPCNLWPLDHSWLYLEEYDLHGIFIAGSEELVAALMSSPDLEVVRSTAENDPWRHWGDREAFDVVRRNPALASQRVDRAGSAPGSADPGT